MRVAPSSSTHKKMKITLVLFSVLALSFAALDVPDHLKASTRILRKACMDETGALESDIKASKNGKLVDNPQMRCYINCFFDHVGMIDGDGKIHFNDVWHLLTPSIRETVELVTKECETQHGDTPCDTAFLTTQCYYRVAPEGAELP